MKKRGRKVSKKEKHAIFFLAENEAKCQIFGICIMISASWQIFVGLHGICIEKYESIAITVAGQKPLLLDPWWLLNLVISGPNPVILAQP